MKTARFAVLISVAMLGCSSTGGNSDEVYWSASISGGVYDNGDDLGFVVIGSITLFNKYPANPSIPGINRTRVKVANIVSSSNSNSQNQNNGGNGNNSSGDDDDDSGKKCGKGHENHQNKDRGKGHNCDPD